MANFAATDGWFTTGTAANVYVTQPNISTVASPLWVPGAQEPPVAPPQSPFDWLREQVQEVVDRGALGA